MVGLVCVGSRWKWRWRLSCLQICDGTIQLLTVRIVPFPSSSMFSATTTCSCNITRDGCVRPPLPTPSVYVIMASSVQPNDSGTVEQSASEITQSSAKYTAALYDQARMTSASVMDAAIGTGATAGSTAVCGVTSLGEIVVWALSNSVTTKHYRCIKRSHSHTPLVWFAAGTHRQQHDCSS